MIKQLDSKALNFLICPDDRYRLEMKGNHLVCSNCGIVFPVSENGIPMLYGKRTQDLLLKGVMAGTLEEQVVEANRNFHDDDAYKYDERHGGDSFSSSSQERLVHNLERLKISNSPLNQLLDIGCGTGNILKNAQAALKVGIDISPKSLDKAKAYTPHVFAGDVSTLPFADNSFEAVTAFSVLHHVFNLEKLLTEVHRVLIPGGRFYSDWDPNRRSGALRRLRGKVLSLPVARDLKRAVKRIISPNLESVAEKHPGSERCEYELANYHEDVSSHKEFNPQALKRLLKNAGFKNIEIYVFDHRPKDGVFKRHQSNWLNDLLYKRFMTFSVRE